MATLNTPLNFNGINPNLGSVGQLPVGVHLVRAVSNEIKETKAGGGGYIAYTLEVVGGEKAGSRGVDRFNVFNSNSTTVRIAMEDLAGMAVVCGIPVDAIQTNLDVLNNIEFGVEVAPQGNNPEYTEVKRRFPASDMPATAIKSAPAQSSGLGGGQPAQPAGTNPFGSPSLPAQDNTTGVNVPHPAGGNTFNQQQAFGGQMTGNESFGGGVQPNQGSNPFSAPNQATPNQAAHGGNPFATPNQPANATPAPNQANSGGSPFPPQGTPFGQANQGDNPFGSNG